MHEAAGAVSIPFGTAQTVPARLLALLHRTSGIARRRLVPIPLHSSLYKENPMKTLTSPRFYLAGLAMKQAANGGHHD
jgi:hypothetical protein